MTWWNGLAVLAGLLTPGARQGASAPQPVAADLVATRGKVWTVARDRPEAEALAVWRRRVVAAAAEVKPVIGRGTRVR